ncbi:hypothetical protein [Paraglaciecola chathamensis]|uniref:Uncharacterized protein n=1 Tax=Paraglaciecola chathamensis S18K6 TaxID=1127672 RepID=A0AAV3V3L8_9ALTE|nr:hypothetical protein [Paraglaciecola chathamensis]GAC11668.1 hypothetical protein GCHA_3738 [Paraglaciecola chathamensis S18K6]
MSKVYAELKIAQQPDVVDNIAKLFGFSRGNGGNCRQFVVFSTLQLFMRFAYFMAFGHLWSLTTYALRALSTASLLTYGLRPLCAALMVSMQSTQC